MDYEERIARWLTNDPGLVAPAVKLASGVTGLEAVNPLWSWVYNLLFDTGYGVQVDDLLWVSNRDASVEDATKIRDEIGPVMFSVANWDRVSQMVKAYANKEL